MLFLRRNSETRRIFAATALVAFLATVLPVSGLVSEARATPREDLDQAIEFFDFADYQAALDLLDGILADSQATGEVLRDTHIYRARCLIGLGNDAEAQNAYCEALKLDNAWRPDGVFYSQAEIAVFDQSFATCELVAAESGKTPWYKKPIVWIGGAVVLVGALALGGGGGGDDPPAEPTTLDDFPPPPETK